MFFSGVVKLASGDPTWHNLTALSYHWWTQPLPTPVAWYLHQLPDWFQALSTAFTFVAELFAPLLIFAPRRLRFLGAALMIALQLLIMLTGNFAYFNLLTIALCVPLLDDALLSRILPADLRARLLGALPEPARACRPPPDHRAGGRAAAVAQLGTGQQPGLARHRRAAARCSNSAAGSRPGNWSTATGCSPS